MFSYFKILKHGKKGQIFPILIAATVILVIAAVISANLGKVSLSRLGCINGADAGATAGISDLTCGYNKTTTAHTIMKIVSIYALINFLVPLPIWCYPLRHMQFLIYDIFLKTVYSLADGVVQAYSSVARQDAYYYALINANIDDPYKEDGRRYPSPGESWSHWVNLKSHFNKWLNGLPKGWQDAGSLTYNWTDGSKLVTVTCGSSFPQKLQVETLEIWGLYYIPIIKFPVPIYHGNLYSGLQNPQASFNVKVERVYSQYEKGVGGFWSAFQPASQASASTVMTGGYAVFDGGFDFILH